MQTKKWILYHYPCLDGAYAALAAYLSLGVDGVNYLGIGFRELDQEDALKNIKEFHEVYLLDFAGSPGFVEKLAALASKVVVIDHHKTAIDHLMEGNYQLPPKVELYMDLKKSGAVLALDYFKPAIDERLQRIFEYVQDNDLWRHKIPETRAFAAGMHAMQHEYAYSKNPTIFSILEAHEPDKVIALGKKLLEPIDKKINELLETKQVLHFTDGIVSYRGYAVEDGDFKIRSELGSKLSSLSAADNMDSLGIIYYSQGDLIQLSLRASEGFDSTRVAQLFGGGGNEGASSFSVSIETFESFKTQ